MASAFLLDIGRCIGCQGCVVACKAGNELSEGTAYITISEQTRGTFPDLFGSFDNHRCYHCLDAACVDVCPTGALFKEDGLTRLDPAVCSGCEYCTRSCPYAIPVMVDGVATKCDGCESTVKAGGTPWCVVTCPSDALRYGPRQEIAAEAHLRATALREKYPNAQVYGENQAGGLGVLMVLPDSPEALGLPENPQPPVMADAWQELVKPAGVGITAVSAVVAGVAAVIARRNHMQELEQIEKARVGAAGDQTTDDEVTE